MIKFKKILLTIIIYELLSECFSINITEDSKVILLIGAMKASFFGASLFYIFETLFKKTEGK